MTNLKETIAHRTAQDLADIENALTEHLSPYLAIVAEITGHIMFNGGKRLRPLLFVLSSRLCGYTEKRSSSFAAIFEYLHVASLLHDDLVDGAETRRGRTAAYKVYGNSTAVLVGDYLLARALALAAEIGNLQVIRSIAAITEQLSQGEIHQLLKKGDPNLTEAEYFQMIRAKTAALMEGACRCGALTANAAQEQVEALTAYGHHIGMAFQMADDLLDYTADPAILGKKIGTDLGEGKMTLPLIRALANGSPAARQEIQSLLGQQNVAPERFQRLVEILEHSGAVEYTRTLAHQHIDQATTALTSTFPASDTREILTLIAGYTLTRKQ